MPHLTQLDLLTDQEIFHLMDRAKKLQLQELSGTALNGMVANVFFEPSTRTRCSFEVAEKRLGLHVMNLDSGSTSTQKGETLLDTVKTLEALGVDALVVRHKDTGYYRRLLEQTSIPIINAGDGHGHHPTQALLDLYTLLNEFETLEGLTISIIGDLRHSRVANSDAELFKRFGANVLLSGPENYHRSELPGTRVEIDEAIAAADAVIMLRIQHERHEDQDSNTHTSYLEEYGLTKERELKMKTNSIILHPAPINRGVEIESELVESAKSRIFQQMTNGVAVRMAVLEWVLQNKEVL